MDEFRADLHCHSSCSDGSLSPVELLQLAASLGLKGLSITDHDTVTAYETAIPIAQQLGIELISGVEFSAVHKDNSIHILGYSFNTKNPLLLEFCNLHQTRRQMRVDSILEKLKLKGMPITHEELAASCGGIGSIGRPHIALAMYKKGYISTPQEAFKLYLGEDRECYVAGNEYSVEQTIELIHKINGFAVLAHPHLIKKTSILKNLIQLPFDGLECYYGRLTQQRWVKIAEHRNWIITGGSDFHGEMRPNIPLGSSWVTEATFKVLQKRYHENCGATG